MAKHHGVVDAIKGPGDWTTVRSWVVFAAAGVGIVISAAVCYGVQFNRLENLEKGQAAAVAVQQAQASEISDLKGELQYIRGRIDAIGTAVGAPPPAK